MDNNRQVIKKKGFSFLSFLLGILFGIIFILAAIFGGGYFVLTQNLDTVFGMFGLDNSKDENGRNKFVNTDPEQNGVSNALELLQAIVSFASDAGNKTIGEIDSLIPATSKLTDGLYSALSQYVELDVETLESTPFNELKDFLMDTVYEIQPAALLGDVQNMNKILQVVLCGIEANYVYVTEGETQYKYPIFVDNFELGDDGQFRREEDKAPLPESEAAYIIAEDGGKRSLFFCVVPTEGGEQYRVVERDPQNVELFRYTDIAYTLYNEEYCECTGNWYEDNQQVRHTVDPITIGSLKDNAMGSLEKVRLVELLGNDGDGIINDLLGDVSVGDLIGGNGVDFNAKIQGFELGKLLTVDLSNKSMLFFAYRLTDLKKDDEDNYTAKYKDAEGNYIPVNVTVEEGKITGVYKQDDGARIDGVTVSEVQDIVNDVDISIFMDVEVTNKIMAYIAYGVYDLQKEGDTYVGKVEINGEEKNCVIAVTTPAGGEEGVSPAPLITSVTTTDGVFVPAAGINELGGRVSSLTGKLKLRDVITIDENSNKLLKKLGEKTISGVGDAINDLYLSDVMDISASSAIIAYLAYGVTDINLDDNTAIYHPEKTGDEKPAPLPATLNVTGEGDDKLITSIVIHYDTDNSKESFGTGIMNITPRIDGLMEDLKICELLKIDDSNTVMNAIKNSTINSLAADVNALTINELYAGEIYKKTGEETAQLKQAVEKVEGSEPAADEIVFSEEYLYYVEVEKGVFKMIGEGENKGKLTEEQFKADKDTVYWTYGTPQAIWQLLLTDNNGETASENAYSINNLTAMMGNVNGNMQKFTLYQLNESGILKISDETENNPLDTELKVLGGDYEDKKLGDLTVPQAITAITELVKKVNNSLGG